MLLFAGPTLQRALTIRPALSLDGIELVPPVRRGDLPRLLRARRAAELAIVDGLFHSALAVGHAEIRHALAAGWQVWGLSSMGAIRAREMHHLGMRGFGRVFARYCAADDDFRDDEVTLLHEVEPPFRELSEPLIHLREALDAALPIAGATIVRQILDELESMWFGERTIAWARQRLLALCPNAGDALAESWRDFDRFRIKSIDLLAFIEQRPWMEMRI